MPTDKRVSWGTKIAKRGSNFRGDLKNAGVGRIPGGVVALVEDEERDVPEPEEAVAEVVEEDLRRHDEHLGPVDHVAPLVRVPEVDAHLAEELGDGEVRVRPDDARLLGHEHDGGDEEDGEAGRRGRADAVREAAEEEHRDERLPGARLEEHQRVPGQRALQRLELVPACGGRAPTLGRERDGGASERRTRSRSPSGGRARARARWRCTHHLACVCGSQGGSGSSSAITTSPAASASAAAAARYIEGAGEGAREV